MTPQGPLQENFAPFDKQQLETIQYHSMVQILKASPMSSSTELREKLDNITNRTKALERPESRASTIQTRPQHNKQ